MARGNLKPVGYSRDNSRLYFRLIILTRELSKLDYEYSNNVDDYYYQQWLESKVIFNHGNNY